MEKYNTLLLAIIAVCQLATPIVLYYFKGWIRKLEINTNSIKDALVAKTSEASEAKGQEAGRQIARQEAKEEHPSSGPLPVTDKEATAAAIRAADQATRTADATIRIANQGDKKGD